MMRFARQRLLLDSIGIFSRFLGCTRKFDGLDTPACIIKLSTAMRNIEKMAKKALREKIALRPHLKTHKCMELALIQSRAYSNENGSFPCVVSTFAEAEFFLRNWPMDEPSRLDLLYGVPTVKQKFKHIQDLYDISRSHGHKFSLLIDNLETASDFRTHFHKHADLGVFIKVDTGYHREGLEPANALHAIQYIEKNNFKGLYSHVGHSYQMTDRKEIQLLNEHDCRVLTKIAQNLSEVPLVSVGSTPTCSICESFPGLVNEIHPGNYVFYDLQMLKVGACSVQDIALTVLSRVIGIYPERNQILIDAGSLALSKDSHPDGGFGILKRWPFLKVMRASQEVSIVEPVENFTLPLSDLKLGDLVEILPNHSCLTAACFPQYHVDVDSNKLEVWTPTKYW